MAFTNLDTPDDTDTDITPDSATATPSFERIDVPEHACEVCGKDVQYAGRGRVPKRCPEHKRMAGTKPVSARGGGWEARLERELTAVLGTVGTGLMFVDSFDGFVVLDRAEPTAQALVAAARQSPAVRKALEQMVAVSVFGTVVTALASVAVPIAAHHNLLPMDEYAVASHFVSAPTMALIMQAKPQPTATTGVV